MDDLPERTGMPLGLRILAGLGAAAFILIGINIALVGLGSLLAPPQRPEPRVPERVST
jgi:hypothetical protein